MNCDSCDECCRWLNYRCTTRIEMEYFKARGADKIQDGFAWFYRPCPLLNGSGCSIHEHKPMWCRMAVKAGDITCKIIRKLGENRAEGAAPSISRVGGTPQQKNTSEAF